MTVTRLKIQQTLRAEFQLMLMLSKGESADLCIEQQTCIIKDCNEYTDKLRQAILAPLVVLSTSPSRS